MFSMRTKQYAFTLVELLVTLTVLGIVLAVAVPSFNDQISKNRAEALGQDLIFALNLARSEAVKRSGFVSLCASADGAECSMDEEPNWAEGFIAVVDYAETENTEEPALTDATHAASTVLRVWEKQNAKALIGINLNTGEGAEEAIGIGEAVPFIRFTKLGTLARMTNPPQGIILRVKMLDGEEGCLAKSAQQYSIGIAGVVRLINENCW